MSSLQLPADRGNEMDFPLLVREVTASVITRRHERMAQQQYRVYEVVNAVFY